MKVLALELVAIEAVSANVASEDRLPGNGNEYVYFLPAAIWLCIKHLHFNYFEIGKPAIVSPLKRI